MRFNTFADVAQLVVDYASTAIPVVFLLCFVAFFFNAGRFITTDSESKDAGERKNWLIWGIIGLAAASLLAGGVALLQNFFFINGTSTNAIRPAIQASYGQNVPLPKAPNFSN